MWWGTPRASWALQRGSLKVYQYIQRAHVYESFHVEPNRSFGPKQNDFFNISLPRSIYRSNTKTICEFRIFFQTIRYSRTFWSKKWKIIAKLTWVILWITTSKTSKQKGVLHSLHTPIYALSTLTNGCEYSNASNHYRELASSACKTTRERDEGMRTESKKKWVREKEEETSNRRSTEVYETESTIYTYFASTSSTIPSCRSWRLDALAEVNDLFGCFATGRERSRTHTSRTTFYTVHKASTS